jgi:hypothetical protein
VVSYQVENLGNVSKKETQALNFMEDVLEDARDDVRIAPDASEPRKLPLHIGVGPTQGAVKYRKVERAGFVRVLDDGDDVARYIAHGLSLVDHVQDLEAGGTIRGHSTERLDVGMRSISHVVCDESVGGVLGGLRDESTGLARRLLVLFIKQTASDKKGGGNLPVRWCLLGKLQQRDELRLLNNLEGVEAGEDELGHSPVQPGTDVSVPVEHLLHGHLLV